MAESKAPFTPDQCRNFIGRYRGLRPAYEKLAEALAAVLKQPAVSLGLPAMVQARAKTIASFAGKIQRTEKGYINPIEEITDFCGARVITLTLDGVSRMCDFVEKNFNVFAEESGDKLDSLGTDTFGYRSVHYIVAFRAGDFPEHIVPPDLIGLKAEIQVRTLLQHAWADVAHEFSYKSAINLPLAWRRELSRLAALLEEGDQAFDSLQHDLLKYATSYEHRYPRDQLVDEIARATIVLDADPGNADVAQALAKMAMTREDWQLAVNVLSAFADDGPAGLLRDLGVCLCKLHDDGLDAPAYAKGQAYLQAALDKNPDDVDSWASLGGTWRSLERRATGKALQGYRETARACYRRAFEIDSSDPYALGNFIEYEMAAAPGVNILPYIRPAILAAIDRCKAQALAGVNLPWAYLDLGEFYLFLEQPMHALHYYALGVGNSSSAFFLNSAARSFDQLENAGVVLPGLQWAKAFLEVSLAIAYGPTVETPGDSAFRGPVVIVAGGCRRTDDGVHRDLVLDSFTDHDGTVISGGTKAGIAADIGALTAANPNVRSIGYVPGQLPDSVALDDRYTEHRSTGGDDFSPLEPIQYWRDIHGSGISMDQVRLIAFGGGALSATECCMALAMGVPVGIVTDRGEPGALLKDDDWTAKGAAGATGLHALPDQVDEVKAFIAGTAGKTTG